MVLLLLLLLFQYKKPFPSLLAMFLSQYRLSTRAIHMATAQLPEKGLHTSLRYAFSAIWKLRFGRRAQVRTTNHRHALKSQTPPLPWARPGLQQLEAVSPLLLNLRKR